MKRLKKDVPEIDLRMSCEAARRIRQHGRSSSKAEICGVVVGSEEDGITTVEASIPGANAVEGGTHVTFTQDTWEHIYRIKDRDYPQARIVGWYHSHPGFGVFLSDHDTFIHKNFFSSPRQVAWVYDPHSDEEGCFGWTADRLHRLSQITFVDDKGGEGAGETGKPEPLLMHSDNGDSDDGDSDGGKHDSGQWKAPPTEAQAALRTGLNILSYLSVLVIGFLLSWYLFPRVLVIPVDSRTGQPLGPPIDLRTGQSLSGPPAPAANGSPGTNNPAPANPGANSPGNSESHPNAAPQTASPAPTPQPSKGKP
jgi:proteasome lid subunit RPN8/RPN11